MTNSYRIESKPDTITETELLYWLEGMLIDGWELVTVKQCPRHEPLMPYTNYYFKRIPKVD